MRHLKAGRKLNRSSSPPQRAVAQHGHLAAPARALQTTDAKAKELRRLCERMITLGKRGTLHARRQALAFVRSGRWWQKLFDDIARASATRPGGYTRITKLGTRRGDAAPLSLIELTERSDRARTRRKRSASAAARAAEEGRGRGQGGTADR
jgi:large subunit ribosomal protein L17